VAGPGRVELAAAMGTSVVMGLVLGQDRPQMPLAEDQHPVGDLGPGREHEPFRIGMRARAPGRDFHGLDAGASQERAGGRVSCPVRSRTRNRESAARSPRSIKRSRICWVARGLSGCAVTPGICTDREPVSITKKQYRRCTVTAQSTGKKPASSRLARRKFRRVVLVRRWGAPAGSSVP
jgi:hypothetical protein